jgi:hypothetical protein
LHCLLHFFKSTQWAKTFSIALGLRRSLPVLHGACATKGGWSELLLGARCKMKMNLAGGCGGCVAPGVLFYVARAQNKVAVLLQLQYGCHTVELPALTLV